MNDLYQIQKQNAKASESVITKAVEAGKHVVAVFTGLNFYTHKEFDSREAAERAAPGLISEFAGAHYKIHSPTVAA